MVEATRPTGSQPPLINIPVKSRSAVSFEQTFRAIDKRPAQEACCTTELDDSEQTSWLRFLRYLDALEHQRHLLRQGEEEPRLRHRDHEMILHGIESPNILRTNPPFGGQERKEVQQNFRINTGRDRLPLAAALHQDASRPAAAPAL